jgi:transcriptional regulator with XRE-family HTH domain
VSQQVGDLDQPRVRPRTTPHDVPTNDAAPSATVLRFPSNAPLDPATGGVDSPRLCNVLGEVLRDERHRQERTLADVAERASVSLPYLSEVERGRKEVSSDVLAAISDALDLPLVAMLERAADRLRANAVAVESSRRSRPGGAQSISRFRLAA